MNFLSFSSNHAILRLQNRKMHDLKPVFNMLSFGLTLVLYILMEIRSIYVCPLISFKLQIIFSFQEFVYVEVVLLSHP